MAISGMASGVLSSRILGPDGRGRLTALLLLPSLLGRFGTAGLMPAVGLLENPARNRAKSVAHHSLVTALLVGLILVVCVLPFVSVLSALEGHRLVAAICLTYVPLNLMISVLLGEDIAAGKFAGYNLTQAVPAVLQLIIMACLFRQGLASPSTFALAVVVGLSVMLSVRMVGHFERLLRWRLTWDQGKTLLTHAWAFTEPEIAGLVLLRLDVFVLGVIATNDQLGLYTVALAIGTGQAIAAGPLSQIVFHATSSATSRIKAAQDFADEFRILQCLYICIGGIAIIAAPTVIRLAFGTEFVSSVHAAQILILAMTAWSCGQALEAGMRGLNLARSSAVANLIAVAILAGFGPASFACFGIEGMASAVLIAHCLAFVLKIVLFCRNTRCPIADVWFYHPRTWHALITSSKPFIHAVLRPHR